MKTFLLLWLVIPAISFSATNYVLPSSAGSANGTDWVNAYGGLPATLTRGDTYLIGSGTYGSYTFDDVNSGTTVTTLQKATAESHGTDTGWASAYGSTNAVFGSLFFKTGHWLMDGVTGGGPVSWETGFGFRCKVTSGNNIRIDDGSEGAVGVVSNITFKHMEVEGAGRFTFADGQSCLVASYSPALVTISQCFFHDVSIVHLSTRNSSGFILEYSKFSKNGTSDGDAWHREFWSASTCKNVTLRHCIIEDISNSAIIAVFNGTGRADNWLIHGNVFSRTAGDAAGNSLFLDAAYPDGTGTNTLISISGWRIFNNTIMNLVGSSAAALYVGPNVATSNNFFYNNIIFSNTCNAIYASGFTSDHNWYYGNTRIGVGNIDSTASSGQANSQIGTSNPYGNWANNNFGLARATSTGTNTDIVFGLNRLDAFGQARGLDGVWDRGAWELAHPVANFNINPPRRGSSGGGF